MTRKSQRGMIPAIETLEGRILLSNLPVVSTLAASSVSETAATLNGSANPQGSTATAAFQYSTSSTFTPSVQTPRGTGFSGPEGVAVDKAGDLFVADNGNNAVKEILPNGIIKTIGSGFDVPSAVAVRGCSGQVPAQDRSRTTPVSRGPSSSLAPRDAAE